MIGPILKNDFKVIDVKEAAENRFANDVQVRLKDMVWQGGCSNWNLDRNGRNTTNSPDNTWIFWLVQIMPASNYFWS